MGSFGQGHFGGTAWGGSTPTDEFFLNQAVVKAWNPSFHFAADHPDEFEHVWFDAEIFYNSVSLGRWDQHEDSEFDIPRTDTHFLGGIADFSPDIAFSAGETYILRLRVTTDPTALHDEGRWWYEELFTFVPTQTAISRINIWETSNRDVLVAQDGTCHNAAPYAEWEADGPYDFFVWNITIDEHNSSFPFRSRPGIINFNTYPLYDGIWYLKIAPMYQGQMGAVYQHAFTVEGTVININD